MKPTIPRSQLFMHGFGFEKRSGSVKACVKDACFSGKPKVLKAFSRDAWNRKDRVKASAARREARGTARRS